MYPVRSSTCCRSRRWTMFHHQIRRRITSTRIYLRRNRSMSSYTLALTLTHSQAALPRAFAPHKPKYEQSHQKTGKHGKKSFILHQSLPIGDDGHPGYRQLACDLHFSPRCKQTASGNRFTRRKDLTRMKSSIISWQNFPGNLNKGRRRCHVEHCVIKLLHI